MSEPKNAPGPAAPGAPRRTLSQESLKVQTAMRAEKLKQTPAGPVSARLKDGAADTALNVVGILRDLWDDFRSQDRFFKFKAMIVGAWVLLSAAGVIVACPGGFEPGNPIGARVISSVVNGETVYGIINESGRAWEDVVVVVNGEWRAAVPSIPHEPGVNTLTLDLHKLLGPGGKGAPRDLRVRELQVRTPRGTATLITGGRAVE